MCKTNVDSLELGVNSASGSGEISPHSFSEEEHRAVDAQELYNTLQAVIDSHRKFVSVQIDEEEGEDGVNKFGDKEENPINEFDDGEEQEMMDNPVTITDRKRANQIILNIDPEQSERNKHVNNEFHQYPIGGRMEKFMMDFIKYLIIGLILYITYRIIIL